MKTIKALAVAALVAMLTLAAMPALAETSVKKLTYPPLSKFEIPEPTKVTLDNGMTLYLLEDHTLPKVNFSAVINKCGGYLDPAAKIGLASMTGEVMRTGGTSKMTGDEIDERLEAIGAYVESYISTVSGGVEAGGLSDYTETVMSIMADVLRDPVFAEDKIELSRTNEKSAISRRNDEPMDICVREFRKLLFGPESPYARHAEYATIDAVTRADMIDFHRQYVQPNNIQLAVWGDFNQDAMLVLIKKYFGEWPKGDQPIPPLPEVKYVFKPTVNYAEKTDINQSNILVGHIGGQMGDPDYPATIVMNAVLGESFGSRLTDNVRTKLGLAYSAFGTYAFNYGYPGWFYAYAATKSESTVKAIREIINQMKSMQTIPPTPQEMKRAKDGWLNSFVFNFDTKGEIIGRMMTYDYFGMPRDYLQQLKDAVEKVTPQDVIEVAKRKLNPENLQILAVGKGAEFDEPLSAFGQVNTIDIAIPAPATEKFAATDEELLAGRNLLSKAAEACGGAANFKKVKSITTEAALTVNTPQGAMNMSLTAIQVMPDKLAQIIKTPMGDQIIVFDGTAGWAKSGGQVQALPASQIDDFKKGVARNNIWLFSNLDQPELFAVADKGDEQFNGKPAKRLEIVTAAGAQFTMFLDPATYLPVGMRYMGEMMTGLGEIIEVTSDYKRFGDVMVATKTLQEAGGMSFETELTRVDVNGAIDAAVFEKPEGI